MDKARAGKTGVSARRADVLSFDERLVLSPAEGRALVGRLRAPGDKSISHRALLIGARAEGRSRIRGLSEGEDVRHTLEAVRLLGACVERDGDEVVVDGGAKRLREPSAVIDVGNSGTGIRLLAGYVACLEGLFVMEGDASIARRPMDRVAVPLRLMGARVDGRNNGSLPPLVVRGGALQGTDYEVPVASAQVKSAVLFAGLGADGPTTVIEPVPTRAHTEEMLSAAGAEISVSAQGLGRRIQVVPGPLTAGSIDVPADPSQAAFWVVAACITPGSDLLLENVYIGQGRAGFVDVLTRMGAHLELVERDDDRHTASIHVRYGPLKATDVGGEEVPALIDEIPVLAVAAAMAEGTTSFRDAAELRVKETDRIATTVAMLRAFGVSASPSDDGLMVEGRAGAPLGAGTVRSEGDHRIAMAGAVGSLVSGGDVVVEGWDATRTSYPSFTDDLARSLR